MEFFIEADLFSYMSMCGEGYGAGETLFSFYVTLIFSLFFFPFELLFFGLFFAAIDFLYAAFDCGPCKL